MSSPLKKVAIIYGGKSVEHRVSINSAKNLFEYMNRDLYDPLLIGITRQGDWYLCKDPASPIESGKPIEVSLKSNGSFIVEGERIAIDIAFPILHGTNGEDGSIQGLLQVMNIPFVGTGIAGSAVCMSKLLTKEIMSEHNIPTSPFLSYHVSRKSEIDYQKVVQELGSPLMVKAANLGSSVGINKADDEISFQKAIDESFTFDHTLIIEKYIKGREIECAVMGNENPRASLPGEIIISDEYEFYTFDAKYVDDKAVTIQVPAEIDKQVQEQVMEACKKAYLALKCEDFARVDIFLAEDGSFYLNEINTIPGFTNSSMFPMMWANHGLSFTDLITELIGLGEERHKKLNEIETSFFSDLDNK